MSDLDVAASLIKRFEGYQGKAYWDVNHYRVGYGSDTEGPEQADVTAFTTTTPDRALANLKLRVPQYMRSVIGKIGQPTWNALNDNQRAALTSIAYNYGSIPQRITVDAGKPVDVAHAIAGLAGDNGGVNAKRRQAEAQFYLKTPAPPSGPTIPPVAASGSAGILGVLVAIISSYLSGGSAIPTMVLIGGMVAALGLLLYVIHQLPAIIKATPAPLPVPIPTPAPADDFSTMVSEYKSMVAERDALNVAIAAKKDAITKKINDAQDQLKSVEDSMEPPKGSFLGDKQECVMPNIAINWKTTSLGVAGILSVLSQIATAYGSGKGVDLNMFLALIPSIGLLFAKDGNVTGGTLAATDEAKSRVEYK